MSEITFMVLEESLGKIVLVKLKGGKALRGLLEGYDKHLNLVLSKTEDVTDGNEGVKLGSVIIRGDNVILISPVGG
ncbi:MAG: LSm family protein [Nitrososphaerota archaeon]|nr:LSm family protein [Candidatus Bathyarchaeota archaeon]MDW8061185.1 LSm family protein [Nitrososphaerota archaeon]